MRRGPSDQRRDTHCHYRKHLLVQLLHRHAPQRRRRHPRRILAGRRAHRRRLHRCSDVARQQDQQQAQQRSELAVMIAPPSTALIGLVLGACIFAAASDAVSRRIPNLIPLVILTGGCGGVVALVTLFVTRRLTVREALVTLDVLVRNRIVTLPDKKATVPYAIAIAFGAL